MKMKVFCIYDSKAEAYLPPFMMRTRGEAIRALGAHVNDPQHNFCKYSGDFCLFELGSWDESTGGYELYKAPHSIGVLLEFRISPKVED